MNPEIHTAPSGARSFWREIDNTLHIWVSEDLDDLSQQRYIQQAKREYGIMEERRRRRVIPTLLPAPFIGKLRSAASDHPAIAAGAAVMAAAGVTAAVIAPATLDDNGNAIHRHPPAAAAPPAVSPSRPGAAKPKHHRMQPRRRAPARARGTTMSGPAGGRTLPVLGEAVSVSISPVATPPVSPPRLPAPTGKKLTVDLPPLLGATAQISPQLQVRIRLGEGHP